MPTIECKCTRPERCGATVTVAYDGDRLLLGCGWYTVYAPARAGNKKPRRIRLAGPDCLARWAARQPDEKLAEKLRTDATRTRAQA